MVANAKREKLRFTDGLMDYLQLVDYRLAESTADKEKIYQFRYQSYLRENAIDENPSERFCDDYDQMDNCWTFGIDYRDQLASSIRIHVATSENPKSPSLDVFPDIVIPLLEKGYKIVDPTLFVADSSTTNFFPVLPFLTFRLACMASDYFDADYCLIPVSAIHSSFYQRIFGLTTIGEPRYYPLLKSPICLMRADVATLWDGLIEQYPVFRSTFTERRMLFEKSSGIIQGANDPHFSFNTLPGKNQLN
jgi:hypothetical protein